MFINLEFDAQAQGAPQSFRDGMRAAADAIDAAYTNNITINIAVGYGEFLGGALPNQNTSEGNIDFNGVDGQGFVSSYQFLRNELISHQTSADQQTAYANDVPNVTDLAGHNGNWLFSSAQYKAFGGLAGNDARLDGAVGMGTAFTGGVLFAGALHELTHAMGRIAGTSFDLFRFNENGSGNRVFGGAIPATAAYMSIDGGATEIADYGSNSDPGDFLNGGVQGTDPFNETVGVTSGLTTADLIQMDILGFTRSGTGFPNNPSGPTNPDFNGDGKTDILWQNDNGHVWQWLMSNASVVGSNDLGNSGNPAWHAATTGDFNGDGKSDILWQNDDGHVWLWDMNGGSVIDSKDIGNAGNPAWHVVTTGDFNGDGKSDILWQNDDGHVWESQMNNGSVIGSFDLGNAGNPAWHVVATGDFNGDGKSDIIWQNDDGHVWLWDMNGGSVIDSKDLGNAGNPAWHVVATGSFGAGNSGIIWQNDDGHVWEWEMSNASVVGSFDLGNAGNPAWHVARTGDYNGDGKSDILWQNDDGHVWLWDMNGGSVIDSKDLGNSGNPAWHILPAHA
ncbi:MAG: FG-GAP-like repeat-containing protein [Hyphomicrobiales bacterium]